METYHENNIMDSRYVVSGIYIYIYPNKKKKKDRIIFKYVMDIFILLINQV